MLAELGWCKINNTDNTDNDVILPLSVWLLIFGVLVSLATVFIKIIIEFPGLLRLKCIYTEDREDGGDTTSRDLEKVRQEI